ncbi:MAG: tRNA pseudouridine(55) synthase TruB [Flammeovirgaceae bacterium]|nr:tRNA pseudouridine(55) synthase TruB [Flammeovirgaceae bacterium]MDW8286929.1 tRNA pseudouridine(55) synthase TruB [Flammeovirgaceae bacterium]
MGIIDKNFHPSPVDIEAGQTILLDKPLRWTSFQAVKKVKYLTHAKKIGHAGTLDPLATGLLILCTGKATKMIETIQNAPKEYIGEIVLGKTTPSYDLETAFNAEFPTNHISKELIHETAKTFQGEVWQSPPLFSAIKIDGKRGYELARKGIEKEVMPRKILIEFFEITNILMPSVFFRLRCSKGTYVRSLAHDFGKALHSGAYLASLRRTKIGDFLVENALTIDELTTIFRYNK